MARAQQLQLVRDDTSAARVPASRKMLLLLETTALTLKEFVVQSGSHYLINSRLNRTSSELAISDESRS